MSAVKISSEVDEAVWRELEALADQSHVQVSGLLTEAIRDYLRKRRVRSQVDEQLEASLTENEKLGRLLAQ